MVIWICGLSGAGKTTVGRLLYGRMKPYLQNLVMLDGDALRTALISDFGHDPTARNQNSMRIANISYLLDQQGIHVICCAVTISTKVQAINRERLSGYHEVYIDVPLEVLEKRDSKKLYEKARRGLIDNVSGIDIPYSPPENPHTVINNNVDRQSLLPFAERILEDIEFSKILGGTARISTGT